MKIKFPYNIFKASESKNDLWNLTKTYLQTSVFYFIFLVVFPYLIIVFQKEISFPFFETQNYLGVLLFCLFTCLGLYSGYIMSTVGKGTPLPFDCANNLVIKGSYKYVRNPMAVAGIGQALSIGLFFGSFLIIIYALSGAVLWHIFIRPSEEKDLEIRFGKAYLEYTSKVKCWIPRF